MPQWNTTWQKPRKRNLAKTHRFPATKFLLVPVDGSAKLGAIVGQILASNVECSLLALNRLLQLVIGNSAEVVLIRGHGGGRHDDDLPRRRVLLKLSVPVNGKRSLRLLSLLLHAFEESEWNCLLLLPYL